ncbi:MAG: MbnP family protein [Bacteroidota bacterium]
MKYSILSIALLLTIALSFTACNNETEGTLELQFQLVYDNEPLVMFENYDYPDGSKVFFDQFQMFLSNSSLIKDGVKEFAFDVQFLDFSDIQDKAAAENGFTISLKDVPVGEYEGMELGLGLSPEWNATTPSDYSSTHPLSNNYWSQWDSYIFTKIEGKADTLGNGRNDHILNYHIGKDPAFSDKMFRMPISIEGGKTTKMKLKIDVLDILRNGTQYIDIRKNPIDHSRNPEVYDFIIANMADAVSMEEL